MDFKDFVEKGLTSIVFQSKSEYELLNFLNGYKDEYEIEFMIDNPFKIEDVLDKIGVSAIRDKKLNLLFDNKPFKKNLLIIDLNMISKSKETHYNLYKEFFDKINRNPILFGAIIILSRSNRLAYTTSKLDLMDISGKNTSIHVSNTIMNYCDNVFSLTSDNELTLLKNRDGLNFSKIII